MLLFDVSAIYFIFFFNYSAFLNRIVHFAWISPFVCDLVSEPGVRSCRFEAWNERDLDVLRKRTEKKETEHESLR